MSTLERVVPAFIVQKGGRWFTRRTGDFTATFESEASAVSKHMTAKMLASHPDGTLTVTPVDGKPLVR